MKKLKEKLEKKLENKINEYVEDLKEFTPSLQIDVHKKGKRVLRLRMGDTYKFYDLASLTKIIFTVPMMMDAVEKKRVHLNDSIQKTLPWWPHSATKIKDVLSHSAGLPRWAPYHRKLRHVTRSGKREALRKTLAKTPVGSNAKSVYSDVDFILLGFVLEALYKKPLVEIWKDWSKRKKLKSLHFCENNKPLFKKNEYAPTENCPWRKKVLRGEVHDDNTWSFGGVSTHAGLFGTLEDVSHYGLLLRAAIKNKDGEKLVKTKTAKQFTKRAVPKKKGDWALGFMLPTKGFSSSGSLMNTKSIGHTGFTGTSIWYDPNKDILITILSNRVHPSRKNSKFVQLRPLLHNWVMELVAAM